MFAGEMGAMGPTVVRMGGGAPQATRFTDTLQGSVTTFGWGDDWLFLIPYPSSANVDTLQTYIRNANGGFWTGSNVNQNTGQAVMFTPKRLFNSVVRSQYAEAEFNLNDSAQGTAVMVGGLFACAQVNSNSFRAYCLTWSTPDANPANMHWSLSRALGAAYTTLDTGANGTVPGSGGVTMGLSVEIQSAQNVVKVWRNGVLVSTQTDNNANRPSGGNLGLGRFFWVSGPAPGTRTNRFRNFVGRIGPRDS